MVKFALYYRSITMGPRDASIFLFTIAIVMVAVVVEAQENGACRNKRPPNSTEIYGCCDMRKGKPIKSSEVTAKLIKKIEEASQYCYTAYKRARKNSLKSLKYNRKYKENFDGYDCVFECTLVRSGLMSESKYLDTGKFTEFLSRSYANEEFEDILAWAVPVCLDREYSPALFACPDGLDGIVDCVQLEMIANCPPWRFEKSEKCDAMQTYLQECIPDLLSGSVVFPEY